MKIAEINMTVDAALRIAKFAANAMNKIGDDSLSVLLRKAEEDLTDHKNRRVVQLPLSEQQIIHNLFQLAEKLDGELGQKSEEAITDLGGIEPESIEKSLCTSICMREYDECRRNFGGNLCKINLGACVRNCNGNSGGGGCNGKVDLSLPVTLYEDIQYGGCGVSVDVGSYPDTRTLGFHDRLSSIKVNKGFAAVVWEHENFTGAHETFFASDSNLHDNPIGGDRMSSLEVRQL